MKNSFSPTLNNWPQARAFSLLAQVAQGRSYVYRWLALVFYPPDRQLLHSLQNRSFLNQMKRATAWLGRDQEILVQHLIITQEKAQHLEQIDHEYERLTGKSIDRVALVESAYRWRDASNPIKDHARITEALQQEYAIYGISTLELDPDHVAVQLEFLAYLSQREAVMWKEAAGEAARQLRRSQRAFLTDHLGRWVPELSKRIHEQMPGSIYAAFANLANTWIQMEYGPGYFTELGS